MRVKKRFSLLPILKLREYAEYVKLREFADVSKEDSKLAAQQTECANASKQAMEALRTTFSNFESVRSAYEFVTRCNEKIRKIDAHRKILKPAIDKARDEYAQARIKAETLRIAEKKHANEYRAHINKKSFEELQEKSIWQNK